VEIAKRRETNNNSSSNPKEEEEAQIGVTVTQLPIADCEQ